MLPMRAHDRCRQWEARDTITPASKGEGARLAIERASGGFDALEQGGQLRVQERGNRWHMGM